MGLAEHGARHVGTVNGVRLVKVDLNIENVFGALGPERFVTLHWTAGRTDKSTLDAIDLCRVYHQEHKAKGWGGIGYHYCLVRHHPTILLLRPVTLKGAHVGGHNTGNVGVVTHAGAPGYVVSPTDDQVKAFRTLLRYAHTDRFPKSHRTDRRLYRPFTKRLGHQDWSGHESNSCPGSMRPLLNLRTR